MAVMVNTYRGNLLDLTHNGSIAVVDYKGKLLYSLGDPKKVAFARSSTKLMQAMVVVESGAIDAYNINTQELAQMCASHNGEEIHVKTVGSTLKKIGLDESYLQCGVHYPLNPRVKDEMKAKGEKPVPIQNNCSGKHSGMLAAVKYLGEDLGTYYAEEHPHQQRILKMIGDVCEIPPEELGIAIDGCGVPVHAMPLDVFAYGCAKMAKPETMTSHGESAKRVVEAVMAYPMNVAGEDTLDTLLMEKYPNKIYIKQGADGYYAGGIYGAGIGFTLKIDSGLLKAKNIALVELLHQIGFIPEEDLPYFDEILHTKIYNHKKEVTGYTKAEFTLEKHF